MFPQKTLGKTFLEKVEVPGCPLMELHVEECEIPLAAVRSQTRARYTLNRSREFRVLGKRAAF